MAGCLRVDVARAVALALVFFAAAAVGVELSREGGNVAAFWPPNAILLGVLMRGPRRDLTLPVGACALANLALNLLLGDPLPVATGFACANMLEVGCAYFLVARSAGLPSRLAGLHELLSFLFGAVLAAPAVAATVGAALVSWNFAAPFWTVWRTWWTADAVGMLLLAPVVATWDGWRQLRQLLAARGGWVTLELAGAGALIAGGLSVSILDAQPGDGYPGLFVLALLWLALRFGIGLTAAAAAACLTAVVATIHDGWPPPFPAGDGSVAARATPLQLFVLSTVLPPLLVAAAVAERTRIEAELRRAKGLLDDALESMAEGFALFDAEQRLVFCNRRYLACFPRTAALRVPGARLPDLRRAAVALGEFRGVDERNGEDWAAEQARIHAAGGGGEYEFADGRWMLATSRKTADGGTVVVWHDTTERKTLELELATAKRRLDDALASMDDGLALYDSRERFILCNPRHREFFPRSADLRVPGAWVRDIWREEVRRGVYKNVDAGDVEAWIAERRAKATATGGGHEEVALADGRWLQFRVSPTAEGGTIVVARDVTERKQLERALTHQATHDALTGLPNRALFSDELRRARARAERDGTRLAVMLVDLDRFKEVNDTRGHTAGDELLVEAARRLRAAVREGDLVARLGGDEFAILAPDKAGGEGFATLARRVTERLAAPWRLGAVELRPGGTVGLTVYPDDPGGSAQLLVNADRALYAAKEAGRGTWASYRDDMRKGGGSLALGAEVAGAVGRGELDLDYQPILVVGTLEVVGVEAPVRWDRPGRGRLPAGAFVPAAERGPAILSLTRFVLARALARQRAWREAGAGDLRVWVNLAPRCLAWDSLVDAVAAALAEAGADPGRLVLEATEGAIAWTGAAEARLAALRHLGVGIAVDDFGAGHSSLARIKALPLDALKIDRAFVAEVADDERDRAVVRCVVALDDSLGLTTTAEGIETGEQLRALWRLGCTLAQGCLFARPMPAPELEAWLGRWRERRRVDPGADLLLLREGKKPSEPQPAVARAAHGLGRRPPSRGDLRRASCRLVGGRPAAAQTMKSSAAAGASSVRPSR